MFLFASPTLLYNSGSQLNMLRVFCACVRECVFKCVCDVFYAQREREGDYVRMPTRGQVSSITILHLQTQTTVGLGKVGEGHWLRFSEAVCCVQVCDRVFTELNPATCLNKQSLCSLSSSIT